MQCVRLFSSTLLLMAVLPAAAQTKGPPPYCPPAKSLTGEFCAVASKSSCPKSLAADASIDALLYCDRNGDYAVACEAYPRECEGGTNLLYEWRVRISGVTYTYPPSFTPDANFGCFPGEQVFVQVTVWNGSASDSASKALVCGGPVE